MRKQILFIAIITVTIYGCKKENLITPISSKSGLNSVETNENSNLKASSYRIFGWIGTGPGTVGPYCAGKGGNCLPDVDITAIAKIYEKLVAAIKNDTQMNFFANNNYATVFGIDEIPQIQDALEKGHLKIRIEKTATIDFNLILKPQHEKFNFPKLANKVVWAIPVVK